MHYGNLVIIEKPADGNVAKAVAEVMKKYENVWWDWYQIGGRWTGVLDGYDPEKDPANADPSRPGEAKWPASWKRHNGDVQPIENVPEDAYKTRFYRVVTGHSAFGGAYYAPWKEVGEMFQKLEMPPLDWLKKEYAGQIAVVVDNHD